MGNGIPAEASLGWRELLSGQALETCMPAWVPAQCHLTFLATSRPWSPVSDGAVCQPRVEVLGVPWHPKQHEILMYGKLNRTVGKHIRVN